MAGPCVDLSPCVRSGLNRFEWGESQAGEIRSTRVLFHMICKGMRPDACSDTSHFRYAAIAYVTALQQREEKEAEANEQYEKKICVHTHTHTREHNYRSVICLLCRYFNICDGAHSSCRAPLQK